MAQAMKQPDWKAMFEGMRFHKGRRAALLKAFEEEREKAFASRTVDDTLKYRQPLKR